MNDDHDLLQHYLRDGAEEAFQELVTRYAGLVYATALRQVRESALAEEVAQSVFTLLARKARSLSRETSLAGWLHHSACHLAGHLCRSESRRRARESAAVAMNTNTSDHPADASWEDVQEVLDESLNTLTKDDREAVLLRFFRGLSLREVGGVLRTSEDAARMKINRALEKMRTSLARRGITGTAAVLSGILASHALAEAPAGLALRLTSHVFTAASGASALTHLTVMTTKAKIAFAAAGAALTVAIGTPVIMHREQGLRDGMARLEEQIKDLRATGPALPVTAAAAAAALPKPPASSDPASAMKSAKALLGDEKSKGGMAKALAGIMKMPGMKQLVESQTRPVMESLYADLLDSHWQLTPAQRTQVMDVLLNATMEAQVTGIDVMQQGVTPENSKKLTEKMHASTAARDAQLKEILGDPAKLAEFLRYDDSVSERHTINQFKDALSKNAGVALTAEQEENLMNMMHRERKALDLGTPLDKETKFDPARYTPESLAAEREKSGQLQQTILNASRAMLQPAQYTVFAESVKTAHDMEKFSLDMAQSIFGAAEK